MKILHLTNSKGIKFKVNLEGTIEQYADDLPQTSLIKYLDAISVEDWPDNEDTWQVMVNPHNYEKSIVIDYRYYLDGEYCVEFAYLMDFTDEWREMWGYGKKKLTRDYKGPVKSVYVTMGARNGAKDANREENDYYATEPKAIYELCNVEKFSELVLEPACGGGHMVDALTKCGYNVVYSDIIDRGYKSTITEDFFDRTICTCDIITNPPYKCAREFVEHALKIVSEGQKVAMFLKLTFLEGKTRRKFFKRYPPKKVWVFSERVLCAKNGDFEALKKSAGGAVAYAWFIWEKGYQGETAIGWLGGNDDV